MARSPRARHPGLGALGFTSVIVTEASGRIVYWSLGAERLYGWRAEEVLGRSVQEVLVPEELLPAAEDIMSQLSSSPASIWEGDFVVRRKDGTRFQALVHDESIEVDGRIAAIVGESTPLYGLRPRDAEPASSEPGSCVRDVLESRLAWLDSFLSSSRSVMSVRELDQLLVEVLATVASSLNADAASLLVTDDAGTTLIGRAAYGWGAEVLRPVHIPIGAGASGRVLATSAMLIVDELDDVHVHSADLHHAGFHSYVGVPLAERGRTVGVLHATSFAPGRFTAADAESLNVLTGPLAAAVTRVRQLARLASIANPTTLPALDGLQICGRYQTADGGQEGGDWYDAFVRTDGTSAVMMGDAAGHGLEALVGAAAVRHSLLAYLHGGQSPADALTALQGLVTSANLSVPDLITAQVAVFEHHSRTLRFASAGHPPLLFLRDGVGDFGPLAGPPISAHVSAARYAEHRTQLRVGDRLVLYTDGVVELRGESIQVGLDRLRAAAGEHRHLPLADYVESLMASSHVGPYLDDRSMVALEVLD